MKRDYAFDNIKCILIFLVVLGHFLELRPGMLELYRMIYLFHMPVFMFVTGYFAKFGWKSLINKIWMYALFQVLYILFERLVLRWQSPLIFESPYWILWYMFVVVFYTALIPFYRAKTGEKRMAVLLVSMVLSIGAGFVEGIEYDYSLSRFFVFQPYFLMGFYAREHKLPSIGKKFFIVFAVGAVLTLNVVHLPWLTHGLLYGAVSYAFWWDCLIRLLLFVVAVIWIGMFWGLKDVLKRRIPIITDVGMNTLSIYLLHGFLMRLGKWNIVAVPQNMMTVFLLTITICLVLGNSAAGKVVSYMSPVEWIKIKK